MTMRYKLYLGFGIMILLIVFIGGAGLSLTSSIKSFSEVEMASAMDAADGVMESRINYLHVIWGMMESAFSRDEEQLAGARRIMDRGLAGFPETLKMIERSGFLPSEKTAELREMFDGVAASGRGILDLTRESARLMTAFDEGVEKFVEQGIETGMTARDVHAVWAMAMAVNDYAAYGEEEVRREFEALRREVEALSLPEAVAGLRRDILDKGAALVDKAAAFRTALKGFDAAADRLDAAMEAIEEGDGGQEGADAYVERLIRGLQAQASRSSVIFMVLMAVGAVIGVVVALAITGSIRRPLHRIKAFAVQVSEGDLEARIDGTYAGALQELKSALERMVGTLREKMAEAEERSREARHRAEEAERSAREAGEARARAEAARREGMLEAAKVLGDIVEKLNHDSGALSERIGQAGRGAVLQRDRAAETATAMEQMNATVIEVARNAGSAAENSEQAKGKALAGASLVERVVESIEGLISHSRELKTNMTELGSQAESIGRIMEVISDIADQTNLLALNAAIEAARAGDAGRGFAVVADEVRKLAEKTMGATKEVGDAITAIRKKTGENIAATDAAVESIARSAALAGDSGQALKEIVAIVDLNADQVRSIATASEEQSAATEQINRSTEEVQRISGEMSAAMTEASHAVDGLVDMAGRLRDLIGRMRS